MFANIQFKKIKSLTIFSGIFVILAVVIYYTGKYYHNQSLEGYKRDKEIIYLPMTLKWDYLIDFDSKPYLYSSDVLTDKNAKSGKYSSAIHQNTGFSSIINLPIPTNDSLKLNEINFKFWLYPFYKTVDASFVYSVFDQHQHQLFWDRKKINENNLKTDIWHPFTAKFKIPGHLVDSLNVLRIYLWNHDLEAKLLIDDITVSFSDQLKSKKPRTFFFDLENNNIGKNPESFFENKSFTITASGENAVSEKIIIPFSKIDFLEINFLEFRAGIMSENNDINAVFIVEIIDSQNNSLLKYQTETNLIKDKSSLETRIDGEVYFQTELLSQENSLVFYLVNNNMNTIRLTDLYLVFKEDYYSENNNNPN